MAGAASAEHSGLSDHSADLITVAQAIHWFNFDVFYAEVRRVLKPKGCLAVIGYGLIEAQDPQLLNYFNTWSGLKHYVKQHNQSPLTLLEAYFEAQPIVSSYAVQFPVLLRSFFAAALWCRWSEKNDVHGGLLYNYSYS